MNETGGPLRRVATRKRSGGPHGSHIEKKARKVWNQSLVSYSQRDETDGGIFGFESTAQWDKACLSSFGATSTQTSSHQNKVENILNKRPLFIPHQRINSDSIISPDKKDENGRTLKVCSTAQPVLCGDVEAEEEWAEDEFRAVEVLSVTSTPSSRHIEVITPDTICSNLSPVLNRLQMANQPNEMHINRSSVKDQHICNKDVSDDWDAEDSLFENLDLSRIVAESKKKDGCNDVSLQSTNRGNDNTVKKARDSSAIVKEFQTKLDINLQLDGINYSNGNKCSMAETSVLVKNCRTTATGDVPSLSDVNGPSKSVTPQEEKWFSHICCSSQDQLLIQPSIVQNTHIQPKCNSRTGVEIKTLQNIQAIKPNTGSGVTHKEQELQMAKLSTPIQKGIGEKGTPCDTPQRQQGSIANRLKLRLQNNAKVVTPVQNRAAQLRKASIDIAMSKAIELQCSARDKDVGPFYGLPSKVQELLKTHRGIDQFYDWQHSCLTLPAVQEGHNLIYSLPTSGGKTLVAEILIMQQLLCHKKDAILVVPYVAIVQEKVTTLSVFAVELGFLVEEYAGSKGAIPPRKRRKKSTLYVATIEKAHSLVNSLIQEQRISNVGLVVVDELHMLGDGGRRGASLEMCLSKLLYTKAAQIVGMSATLSNIQDLCTFMKAELYTSDFRPVELKEYVKVEDNIFAVKPGGTLCPDEKFVHSRTVSFPYSRGMLKSDPDHLIGLALEVIPDFSCLIFCATKKNCQNVAEIICKNMPRDVAKKIMAHKVLQKKELLLSLRRECDNHLCATLKKTVPYGLAYHHSGLTMDERKLIEDAYSEGTLCLLTCTSTLAAGVNLPAKRHDLISAHLYLITSCCVNLPVKRYDLISAHLYLITSCCVNLPVKRVVLRSPYIAKDLLTSTRYKQMVGRAGRAGIDTSGESIMIIKPQERPQVTDMLSGPLEGCYSSLMHDEGKGMRGLVLTLIALKITESRKAVVDFMCFTLFGVQTQESEQDLTEFTLNALQQLIDLKLVNERMDLDTNGRENKLVVTKLGQAAFKGSIDIDLCGTVYKDLKFACDQGLVLANALHLLYLVTPYDQAESMQPNWIIYDRQYSRLGESERKVSDMIGVTDLYLNCKITGKRVKTDNETDFHVRRFYLTLMLWNLLNQKSIWDVSSRFDVPRGFIQNLFASAASFASSVHRFCEDLPEFWAFQQLLTKVVYDLTYLATSDIVSLMEVPGVKQGRAKQLVKAGYKTLRHLAHADPDVLMQEVEHLPRKIALQIVAAAKMELAERAEALREEAEELASKPVHETSQ